jgi:hypothetical protein
LVKKITLDSYLTTKAIHLDFETQKLDFDRGAERRQRNTNMDFVHPFDHSPSSKPFSVYISISNLLERYELELMVCLKKKKLSLSPLMSTPCALMTFGPML